PGRTHTDADGYPVSTGRRRDPGMSSIARNCGGHRGKACSRATRFAQFRRRTARPALAAPSVAGRSCLTEAAGHVVLGPLLARPGEDLLGAPVFDELPGAPLVDHEEGYAVGHTRSLLHIVRHDDDGVLRLQLTDQIFDPQRGDGVE